MTARVTDGFANVLAGLGRTNPKTAAASYGINFSPEQAEAAYDVSTWFGKIIDIPADDAVREWRAWSAEKDEIEGLEAEEARLGIRQKVRQGLIWSRLFGGAALVLALPGDPDKPARRVAKGDLRAVTVLHRHEIQAQGLIVDPFDPLHGEPEHYTVNSQDGQTQIHPSRVVRINGRSANVRSGAGDGWGKSEWLHLQDAVEACDGAAAVVSALLVEAKIDIMKVKDLHQGMLTDEGESAWMRRFALVGALKSVANTTIMDAEDEWDQKAINFAGIPDTVMLLLNIMAGAADIPMTRLLGSQAKGLGNGGDVDLKHYYDSVKAKQELVLTPALERLDDALIRSALGDRPESVWYSWRPLLQLSDMEKAEIEERYAGAADKLVGTGLINNRALAAGVVGRMVESGAWPGLEQAIEDSESAGELDIDVPEDTGDPDAEADLMGDTLTEAEQDEIMDRVIKDPRKPVIERLWRYLTRGD